MRQSFSVLVVAVLALAPVAPRAQPAHAAEHHEFVDRRTSAPRAASTLPKARIVYGTYGHLNAARDNAVLLPSHYMANHHGYEWLIGPGRALDTATAAFSSRRSCSATATRRRRATRRSRFTGRGSR